LPETQAVTTLKHPVGMVTQLWQGIEKSNNLDDFRNENIWVIEKMHEAIISWNNVRDWNFAA